MMARPVSQRQESGRFLKKAAQKLFVMLGHGRCRRQRPKAQKTMSGLQKEAFSLLAYIALECDVNRPHQKGYSMISSQAIML
jgi:hypothetical protein